MYATIITVKSQKKPVLPYFEGKPSIPYWNPNNMLPIVIANIVAAKTYFNTMEMLARARVSR